MLKVFSKSWVIVIHLLFWTAVWSVPIFMLPEMDVPDDENMLAQMLIMTGLFYFNTEFLYPNFLAKKKNVQYILFALIACIIASGVYTVIRKSEGLIDNVFLHAFFKVFFGVAFVAIGTLYKIIYDNLKTKSLRQQQENETLKTELSFLRSQVSPHFMFNVLNTLVAKIRQQSDDLEDTVIEISNLMRYMLYDSDEEKVGIKTECEYLKSYIDLQMKRFENSVQITAAVTDDLPDKEIEPMLLIPLVENAFKHGTNSINKPEIDILLNYENEQLNLIVINSKNEISKGSEKRNSGIGLENLKRRLDLLYFQKHSLVLEDNKNQYKATLSINLSE